MTQNRKGVTRRRVIKTIGILGAVTGSSGIATADGRTEPPGNAPTVRVSPWPGITEVPVGHWINHRISINVHWADDEEKGTKEGAMESITQFLDDVDCDAWIDGEQVADPNDHWTEPVVHEEEHFVETEWRFVTPPKPPGKKYVFTFAFHQPYNLTLPDDALDGSEDPRNVEIVKHSRAEGNGNN